MCVCGSLTFVRANVRLNMAIPSLFWFLISGLPPAAVSRQRFGSQRHPQLQPPKSQAIPERERNFGRRFKSQWASTRCDLRIASPTRPHIEGGLNSPNSKPAGCIRRIEAAKQPRRITGQKATKLANFWAHPLMFPAQQFPGISRQNVVFSQFSGFRVTCEFFHPHPLMWKTPTAPGGIRTQTFAFVLFCLA